MRTVASTANNEELKPYMHPELALTRAVEMAPNLTIAKGQLLGKIMASGKYDKYQVGGLANPLVAPTPTTNTTGGALVPGTYYVAHSYKNATGETLLSPVATLVIPAGTNTNTAVITAPALPVGATGINAYLGTSPLRLAFAGTAGSNVVTATALPTTQAVLTPTRNGTVNTGVEVADGWARYSFRTDADGLVYRGTVDTPISGLDSAWDYTAPMFFCGIFLPADLVGLDAGARLDLGVRDMAGGVIIRIP